MNGKEMRTLYKGEPLPHYDCLYSRGSFRYASILQTLSSTLPTSTYQPFSSNAFIIGHDKLLTHIVLQQHKIPMPQTYVVSSLDIAKNILSELIYPVVLKFPSGTHGKGVMFADSESSAVSLLDALHSLNQPFIIQEYIETEGVDVRALVVGGKVVACMRRKAESGENRANIHAGGKGEAYIPSPEIKQLAIAAAKAVNAEICAVDLLEKDKMGLVIEVNLSPGLQGITAATKINSADYIARHLFDSASKLHNQETVENTSKIMQELGIDVEQVSDNKEKSEVITSLDFRGNRILLPEAVSNTVGFDNKTDVTFSMKKGELIIKKFN